MRFFERHGSRWPGILADPFDLLELHELEAADIHAIEAATAGVGAIYRRLLPVLHSLPDEALRAIGVRPETLQLARATIPGLEVPLLARLDLARTAEGYKLLEYNSEAPGLVVETFGLNALACADAHQHDVNAAGPDILATAVRAAVRRGAEYVGCDAAEAASAFSYSLGSTRERAAAGYLADLVQGAPAVRARVSPLESLRPSRNGLFFPDGQRVDVLWRSCPLYHLGLAWSRAEGDTDESGDAIVRLIRERKLAVVNAPDASLLASKAAQAVIWGLALEGLYFSEGEADLVRTYFLPTFLDPPDDGEPYVVKPAFGSEGDSITIVDSAHIPIRSSPCTSYSGETDVYQKYVELPVARLMTERGARDLRLVTSCFLVSGQPAGIILRAGEEITDDEAWVVPVGGGVI